MPMLARLSGSDFQHGLVSLNALHIKVCQGGDKLPLHSYTDDHKSMFSLPVFCSGAPCDFADLCHL